MENNSLQIGLCFTLSHWWQVPGKVLNLCNCWATVWFSAEWILEALQSPLSLWWSHYELCHRCFINWEKCWNIAREQLILYGSPMDRAGKSLRSRSIPLSCKEERWMWFVLENKSQVLVLSTASLVTSLLALKIAPGMFCVADGNGELDSPCCQILVSFLSETKADWSLNILRDFGWTGNVCWSLKLNTHFCLT